MFKIYSTEDYDIIEVTLEEEIAWEKLELLLNNQNTINTNTVTEEIKND